MVPAEFQPFFTASTAASAALIGLLFVSVSVAPEKVFGGQAEAVRQARALSAFASLANIFFISFACLIPHVTAGPVISGIGLVGALQTLGLLTLLPDWRAEGALVRSSILFLGSAAIYGGEIALGIQLWMKPSEVGALTGVLELILGAYAIGLGRAWELLGAPRTGLVSRLLARLDRPRGRKPQAPSPRS
jgi:hypothetical protein